MSSRQNIYDNEAFFEGYKRLRDNPNNANLLIEKPALFSLCPDLCWKTVLDLGCGYGENCVTFSEMGAEHIVGVDISEKMLTIANEKNKRENIRYIKMDMNSINEFDKMEVQVPFDVVFSSMAMHYIEDVGALFKNVANLLNKGGYFIFSQEHPLTLAPVNGVQWEKDEQGNAVYYKLTDYMNEGQRSVSWIIDGVIKYHRGFSTIINSLSEAGFMVERMTEAPNKDQIDRIPQYAKKLHKPDMLLIKAKKL